MAQRQFSYVNLVQQKALLVALTLGLVAVLFWMGIDIIATSRRTKIPAAVQRLAAPLNPLLNLAIVQTLESYPLLTPEQVRSAVEQKRAGASPSALPALPSVAPVVSEFVTPTPAASTL
jgi:hypothetical protein